MSVRVFEKINQKITRDEDKKAQKNMKTGKKWIR